MKRVSSCESRISLHQPHALLFFPVDLVLQPAKEPPSPHLLRQSEGRRRPHQNPLSRDSHARGACPPPRCSQLSPWVLVGPCPKSIEANLGDSEIRVRGPPCATSSGASPRIRVRYLLLEPRRMGETGWQPGRESLWTISPCPLPAFYLECTRAPMETGLPISRSIGRTSFRRSRKWGQVFTSGEESSGRGRRNLCTRSCTSC